MTAPHCYFENVFNFIYDLPRATVWRGERDYYRFAVNVWNGAETPVNGLLQWRAYTGSPETGSVEGDSPLWDPQMWRLPADGQWTGVGADVGKVASDGQGGIGPPVQVPGETGVSPVKGGTGGTGIPPVGGP